MNIIMIGMPLKIKLIVFIFSFNLLFSNAIQNDECSNYKSLWYSYKYPYTDGLEKLSSPKTFGNMCSSNKCCDDIVQNEMVAVSKIRVKFIAEKHFQTMSELLLNTSTITNEYLIANIDSSKQLMNQMFSNTYTYNYKPHQSFFYDFYDKLKKYTDGKLDNLQSIMDNFFADMAERIVGMMVIAKKDPETVRCLTNNLMKLDPYQGADKIITTSILNSYPLARMFVNGIKAANDVFIDLIKDKTMPSWDCAVAFSKAFYCPLCSGSKSKPCDTVCRSTIGQCLGSLNSKEVAKLSKAWIKLVLALTNVSKKLTHPFNFPEVNKNLHVKISDAIMNVHNFFPNVRDKIWATCKSQPSRKRRSSDWNSQYPASQSITGGQSLPNDVDLNKLVKAFLSKIPEMKIHLKKFKNIVCSENKNTMVDSTPQCWNGATSSSGAINERKQKNNRNLPIDPAIKKSINKLNEISSLLNLLVDGQNKDPRAFKIEYVPAPKKPANRQGDDTVPTVEGSGDVDPVIPEAPKKTKEPVLPNEEVVEGSGGAKPPIRIKKNETNSGPSFPQLPTVVPEPIVTMKPDPPAPVTMSPDDEDLTDAPVNKNKNEVPIDQIEGSGLPDNDRKPPVLPVIITTTTAMVTTPEPVQPRIPSQIDKPIEGSGFDGSPDDETLNKPNNPMEPRFPVIIERSTPTSTTDAPVSTVASIVPQELPGEIPQEIWIPRAMDYDSYGRLISVTTKGSGRPEARCHRWYLVAIFVVIGAVISM